MPCFGRPVTSAQDAVVEISASRAEVTVVYCGPAPMTPAVVLRPLDPALTVPGHLVADECLAALGGAFG